MTLAINKKYIDLIFLPHTFLRNFTAIPLDPESYLHISDAGIKKIK